VPHAHLPGLAGQPGSGEPTGTQRGRRGAASDAERGRLRVGEPPGRSPAAALGSTQGERPWANNSSSALRWPPRCLPAGLQQRTHCLGSRQSATHPVQQAANRLQMTRLPTPLAVCMTPVLLQQSIPDNSRAAQPLAKCDMRLGSCRSAPLCDWSRQRPGAVRRVRPFPAAHCLRGCWPLQDGLAL
jgi:hypothetical protein